jgi:hypothetical protein
MVAVWWRWRDWRSDQGRLRQRFPLQSSLVHPMFCSFVFLHCLFEGIPWGFFIYDFLDQAEQSGAKMDDWCIQNTCMNFVVYGCIFLYIIMLLVVIIMICNDLWGFSIDPPYFGYNSAEQKNHVLCIFTFQKPSRTQIDVGFFGR